MDATLTQILSELYAAHQTIDTLRAEVTQLREQLTVQADAHPREERNGAITAVPL